MNSLGIKTADWRSLGIALLIAFVSFFIAMMAWLGWRYRPRQRDPVIEAYTALKLKLAKAGVTSLQHEGPVDYLARAAAALPMLAPQLKELRDIYVGLRYQPNPSTLALSHLRHLVNQLRV
jgi:hypothetical protein